MARKNFYPQNFGLKPEYLYEVLATTFSKIEGKNEIIPNTSCMGIRLVENKLITITPYPDTITYKNLKETGLITLDFVEDIYLYALACLKGVENGIEFSNNYYDYKEIHDPFNHDDDLVNILIPFIDKAWGTLTCIIAGEREFSKEDGFGEVTITEFKLHVISFEFIQKSFNLFNRADNLVLESIVLASRLSLIKKNKDLNLEKKVNNQLDENIKNIERFSKNKRAFKAVDIIKKYINSL